MRFYERSITMSKEERHLETKIRIFEDMILRSKNMYEIEKIAPDLTKMRVQLQRMKFARNGA